MKGLRRKESKRQPAKLKFKIAKKVKEHRRKLKKAVKQNPMSRKKLKKDLGIPNLWPFKEELLQKMAEKREEKKQEKKERKQTKKERQAKNQKAQQNLENAPGQSGDDENDDAEMSTTAEEEKSNSVAQMAKLQFDARRRADEFDSQQGAKHNQEMLDADGVRDIKQEALSGVSKRAYYREFKKVVELADVIVEVLDTRDPLGCRSPDVEKSILSKHPDKKIVLLLNKIDLVPNSVVQQWLEYLRVEFPTIAFKSATQQQRANLEHIAASAATSDDVHSGACVGADTLLQLLKNYSRSHDIKKNITVGVIGYPNVGKSSVINSLKRAKVADVGSTPGVTRTIQEVHLDRNIKLLDSPGIIFSSGNLESDIVLRNCVRIEKLDDPITPIDMILKRCTPESLIGIYKISEFSNTDEFLDAVATVRKMLRKGGAPDRERAARVVLEDWNRARIPFYTLPPARSTTLLGETDVQMGGVDQISSSS